MNAQELEKRRKILRELGFVCSESPLVPETPIEEEPAPPARQPSAQSPVKQPVSATIMAGPKKPIHDFPNLPEAERTERLSVIEKNATKCEACRLHLGRTNSVPGEGNPLADLMFIGEGPGFNEDKQGRPFVGKAGQLLDKIIIAMKFSREEVFISNIVKCRPPENRKPLADEMGTCFPFTDEQMEVIKPKVIVTLGVTALSGLLPEFTKTPIGKIRGQWQDYRGIKVMPTLHPAYLLRQPVQKKFVWEDMQKVMAEFGKKA